jgi:glycosyltransferase involved in cell wall biosynthesis
MRKRKNHLEGVLCVTALGDYRLGVIRELERRFDDQFAIVAGVQPFDLSIRTLTSKDNVGVAFVDNIYIGNRWAMLQLGTFWRCFRARHLIMDLNPRVLNVWIVILLRRLVGRKSIVWGHAWPRSGPDSSSDKIRACLRNLAGSVIVYTETQAVDLRAKYPKLNVVAAPNALYSKAEIYDSKLVPRNPDEVQDIIYVGRLVAEKKPRLLLDAFAAVISDLPPTSRLVFVGAGPEMGELKRAACAMGIHERVVFAGHVAGRRQLLPLYKRSLVSVSAGYVGLSITQSFSFGLPMLISRDEPHAPEIEAAVENENCVFFETDSVESLGNKLKQLFAQKSVWLGRYEAILSDCAERYSVEVMAERIAYAMRAF